MESKFTPDTRDVCVHELQENTTEEMEDQRRKATEIVDRVYHSRGMYRDQMKSMLVAICVAIPTAKLSVINVRDGTMTSFQLDNGNGQPEITVEKLARSSGFPVMMTDEWDKPLLPPKSKVIKTFGLYRNLLMKRRPDELPVEIVVEDEEHMRTLRANLMNRPDAIQKLGVGMACIFVRRFMFRGQEMCLCFLRRIDGTETPFSLYVAYKPKD